MSKPIRILLQTTVPSTDDNWGIDRLSMLRDYLVSIKDDAGNPACDVVARVGGASLKENRQLDANGDDPILSTLGDADFDELWLFALDMGDGLSSNDYAGIAAFHRSGGGILTTRDHQDLGISLCGLGEIGALHFFQSRHRDPDPAQHCIDDTDTPTISWPNYHSGRNGDYQRITPVEPIHPLFRNSAAPSGANAKRATKAVELFPAHPHEGAVGVPVGSKARVIATGISQTTGRSFNLVVAIDRLGGALLYETLSLTGGLRQRERDRTEATDGESPGRVIAQSTFHHFADYNWDVSKGCPSFVDEPEGDGMQTEPSALSDIHAYVRNLVACLAPVTVGVASALENRVIVDANRDDDLCSEIIPNARLQNLDRVGTFT
jgi:hypothetical protein